MRHINLIWNYIFLFVNIQSHLRWQKFSDIKAFSVSMNLTSGRTVQFFPPSEYWVGNSNFRGSNWYLHNIHLEPFVKVVHSFTEPESKSSETEPQDKGSYQRSNRDTGQANTTTPVTGTTACWKWKNKCYNKSLKITATRLAFLVTADKEDFWKDCHKIRPKVLYGQPKQTQMTQLS